MIPKLSSLMIALLFISCNNNDSKKQSLPVQKDSVPGLPIVSNKSKEKVDTIYVKSTTQITGTWEDLGKEPLTVAITKNTIAYLEHHEPHNFKIKSDSIYIYYHDMVLIGRPYLIKDTFVIAGTDGESKYIRLKNVSGRRIPN